MPSLSSAGIVKAATQALLVAQPELNMVRYFAYDMSPEFSDWGLAVKVPILGTTELSDFNTETNNYENDDGSISWATVLLNKQPKATFEFTGKDVLETEQAPYWTQAAEAAGRAVKQNISKAIGSIFLSTEITASTSVGDLSDMTLMDYAELRDECLGAIDDTVLVLNPAYYTNFVGLLPANIFGSDEPIRNGYIGNVYGFKAAIWCKYMPEGVKGALVPSQSIAFAARAVTVADETPYSEIYTATDDFGFAITFLKHGAARTGKGYINGTSLFGLKVVQPDSIKLIV